MVDSAFEDTSRDSRDSTREMPAGLLQDGGYEPSRSRMEFELRLRLLILPNFSCQPLTSSMELCERSKWERKGRCCKSAPTHFREL